MDELERVRELYGEPQADPFLKARVFGRLEAEPRRRRRRLSWTVAATGLATTVAVAMAVVVTVPAMTGSGDHGDPRKVGPSRGCHPRGGGSSDDGHVLARQEAAPQDASGAAGEGREPLSGGGVVAHRTVGRQGRQDLGRFPGAGGAPGNRGRHGDLAP
ncbi:hypothetical protein GCM10018952_65150 [Streptosporangium vulgare]